MNSFVNFLTALSEPVFKASWQAAVLVAIVVAVRAAFGERLSARWRHALWCLVLARLLLPAVPSSALSIFNYAPVQMARESREFGPTQNGHSGGNSKLPTGAEMQVGTSEIVVRPYQSKTPSASHAYRSRSELFLGLCAVAWLVGAGLLTLRVVSGLRKFQRSARDSQTIKDSALLELLEECRARMKVRQQIDLFASNRFTTPCLIGFLLAKLQIPAPLLQSYDEAELRLIFLHELAHVKRHDILINWLASLALIVHWFNPFVWLALGRMRGDREVASDALALIAAGEDYRGAYGEMIIRLLEGLSAGPSAVGSVGILEGRHQIRERIRMIARFKAPSRRSLLAIPLLLALGMLCLTDAQVREEKAPTPARSSAAPAPLKQEQPVKSPVETGTGRRGIIVTRDGKPAVEAKVFLWGEQGSPYIDKPGEAREGPSHPINVTGPDGLFRFNPAANQRRVVILHKDGYLEVPMAELGTTNRLVLQPYGRVEGTLLMDGKRAANQTIKLGSMVYPYDGMPGSPRQDFFYLNVDLTTETDARGKFSFEKVPPGERLVCQILDFEKDKEGSYKVETQRTFILVKSGETSHVDLGSGGKKVIGRTQLTGIQGDFVYEMSQLQPRPPLPDRPVEKDFPNRLDLSKAWAKYAETDRLFRQSDEGLEFERTHRTYGVLFDENGGFVVNDVLPGEDKLILHPVPRPKAGAVRRFPSPGSGFNIQDVRITVPKTGSRAVDLGTILLQPDRQL